LFITDRARRVGTVIVEGLSALGTAQDARNPAPRQSCPSQGQDTERQKARADKILKNAEIQALILAIGAGVAEDFDFVKIRYHKVILLADADVDGSHIRTLLLTFFMRQMKSLIELGHVYVAQPPLYSTLIGNAKVYLKDDIERARFVASIRITQRSSSA